MEHIEPTIKKKAKELAGTFIQCKFCESRDARIILEQNRWKVSCPVCLSNYYLKEQHSLDNAQTL